MKLKDLENILIVTERDEYTIRAANYIVDIGTGAGVLGERIVAEDYFKTLLASEESLTGAYFSGRRLNPMPTERRSCGTCKLSLVECTRNNLCGFNVELCLGSLFV